MKQLSAACAVCGLHHNTQSVDHWRPLPLRRADASQYRTQLTVSCRNLFQRFILPDSWPRSLSQLSVHHAAHRTGHANVGGGPLEVGQGSLTTKISPSLTSHFCVLSLGVSPADSADRPGHPSPPVWILAAGSSCCLEKMLHCYASSLS